MISDDDHEPPPSTAVGRPCPICGQPMVVRWRPFCSKRCADIDLGRWLGEAYRIPVREDTDEPEGGTPPAR